MKNIIIIADSRGGCRQDFIASKASKNEINNLMLSLECQINDRYYDALDLVRMIETKESVSENRKEQKQIKQLRLSDTISLGGIFLYDFLKAHGYGINYISNFFTEKQRLSNFLDQSPLAVLISSTFLNIKQMVEQIDYVNDHNPKVPVIVGGQLVDYLAHFQPYIFEFNWNQFQNALFIWDAAGEKTLLSVLEALEKKHAYESIPNLIYYRDQKPIRGKKIEESNAIDHHLIRWNQVDDDLLRDYVPVQTSAGCPFQCTFCTFAKLHRKIKQKPVASLEKELQRISQKQIKHVMFVDDLVAITKERIMEIARMIVRNKFGFTWSALLRSDSITDTDMVKLLKESGLVLASLGIESFDQTVLDNMKKRTTAAKHFNAIKLLQQVGIFVNGFFVFGYPGETEASIERTVKGIKESGIDLCEVHLWNNVPGAPIYDSVEFGLKGGYADWSHNSMNSVQAMRHIAKLFEEIPHQFGMTDDNVLPLVLLLTNGFSNSRIKALYAAKSDLVLCRTALHKGQMSPENYKKQQEKILNELSITLRL